MDMFLTSYDQKEGNPNGGRRVGKRGAHRGIPPCARKRDLPGNEGVYIRAEGGKSKQVRPGILDRCLHLSGKAVRIHSTME